MQTRRYFTLQAKDEVRASEAATAEGEDVDWLGCMLPRPAASIPAAQPRGEEPRVGAAAVDVSVGDDGVVDARDVDEMAMALDHALFDAAAETNEEAGEYLFGLGGGSGDEETFCNPGEIDDALTDASSSSSSGEGEAAHDAVAVADGASSDVVDAERAALLERNPDDIKVEMLADHKVWEISGSGEPIKLLGTARYVREWSNNVKLCCECHRVRSPAISHLTTNVARSLLYY